MSRDPTVFGRRAVTILDLALDFCPLVHSTAPCTAPRDDGNECFNTLSTCQALPAYEAAAISPRLVRFLMVDGPMPTGIVCYPGLARVKLSPGRIDLKGGLGGRESVTFSLADFDDDDVGADPYVNNRPPADRRSFFRRLLARNPNYIGRPCYLRSGYLAADGSLNEASLTTRRYILETIRIRPKGVVEVVAKDVLKRLEKSMLPLPSEGELAEDIDASTATWELKAGQGAAYGSAPFYVRCGDEIAYCTAISADTLTVTRPAKGTTAEEHAADDRVQKCEHITGRVDDAWSYLLESSGIDASLIDTAGAADEVDVWLSGFSIDRLISVPTPVDTLTTQLLQDASCYHWWDAEAQLVKFGTPRPLAPGETATEIDAENQIVADSVEVEYLEDERRTRVAVYFAIEDWSRESGQQDQDAPAYTRVAMVVDADAESAFEFGDVRPLTIYSPWVPAELYAEIASAASRTLGQRRNPPRRVKFQMHEVDAESLAVGDRVTVTPEEITDASGAPVAVNAVVIEKHPSDGVTGLVRFMIELTDATRRWAFYAEETTSDWPDNGEYAVYTDDDGLDPDGTTGAIYV